MRTLRASALSLLLSAAAPLSSFAQGQAVQAGRSDGASTQEHVGLRQTTGGPVVVIAAPPVALQASGVVSAAAAPPAKPENLNLAASAVAAPEKAPEIDPKANAGTPGEASKLPSAAHSGSAGPAGQDEDPVFSAGAANDALFDARKVKIGPELTFESPQTERSWRNRLALSPITNNKVIRTAAWIFNLRKTSKRVDPQTPTKRGGEHAGAVALEKAILAKCSGCVALPHDGKFGLEEYKIRFPNGYWVNIAVDPATVEIQTPPLSAEEYLRLEGFVQENVFDRAAEVGLSPRTDADGHLNIGVLSAFPKVGQFAEFMLDQVNHPELGLGVLGEDLANAPPLAVQDPKQMAAFFKAMDKVKDGSLTSHKELATVINTLVYYKTKVFNERSTSGRHYQAVSIKRLERDGFPFNDAPVELRYNVGRLTFGQTLLAYDLILRRIAYLNKRSAFSNLQRETFVNPENMSPSEKLSRFYIFVREMGEDFDRYRGLIASPMIAASSLDAFAAGGTPDWSKASALSEVERYLPDLETSTWARRRMAEILNDAETPTPIRESLSAQVAARLTRAGIPAENKKVLGRWWGAR